MTHTPQVLEASNNSAAEDDLMREPIPGVTGTLNGWLVHFDLDPQAKLLGPNGGYYLPCECGSVEEVPMNTVAYACKACFGAGELPPSDEEGGHYDAGFSYAAGYPN